MLLSVFIRARSEVGLSRLPVTEKIAGSNPVGPAMKRESLYCDSFFFLLIYIDGNEVKFTSDGAVRTDSSTVQLLQFMVKFWFGSVPLDELV